jgi:DNA-binding HxlR family transcriptional regulator
MNMKTMHQRRSLCPISFSLEMVGDLWSLLIVRDIVYFGRKTYGEFLSSNEGIARNILATRLVQLEHKGILLKKPHPTDGRKDVYELTEKGLDLIPILLDMAAWGAKHEPETAIAEAWLEEVPIDRQALITLIRETVQNGGSIFMGKDTVLSKLQNAK